MGWPNFRFCFTFSNLSPAIGACLAAATKYDESNDKSFRTSEFLVNESVCLKLGITVYLSHDFNIQTFQYSCLFVFGKQYSLVLLTTQGKIDLRNESGRPMKVKVVGEVSEK